MKSLHILVMADTHNRLRSGVEEAAAGVDEIWHLGDVCERRLLHEIEGYGPPVQVVRGNCDGIGEWPLTLELERNGLRFRLQHIPPSQIVPGAEVILHGHTHVPRYERKGSVLFLNPGCVTRPNRGAPPSVAHLTISEEGKLVWKLIALH